MFDFNVSGVAPTVCLGVIETTAGKYSAVCWISNAEKRERRKVHRRTRRGVLVVESTPSSRRTREREDREPTPRGGRTGGEDEGRGGGGVERDGVTRTADDSATCAEAGGGMLGVFARDGGSRRVRERWVAFRRVVIVAA